MYSGLLTASEIYKNVHDPYFRPSNGVTMYWFRANIPEPGSVTTIGTLNTDEFLFKPVFPQHRMATTYTYNSTNQVSKQQSPDGGVNRFWYDLLSRLSISQNDKQLPGNDYSYTTYDVLGRITEVSQKKQTTVALNDPDYLADATLSSFAAAGTDSQITHTYYDAAAPATNGMQSVTQNNLRKRVASSTYRDTQTGQVQQATYYDYDLDGNVKTLYQQLAGLDLKRIDYEYDLVSGKVNFVSYQKNQPDQFYYSYNYDAENRLTEAWSSPLATLSSYSRGSTLNTTKRRMDASYKYYLHGPLARMELGDVSSKVQGVDYAYTLQGWLKGVNRSIFRFQPQLTTDMGNDGSNGVPKGAFNYNLYYYLNDYKPIQGTDPFEHELQEDPTFYPLYNGNIAGIGQTLPAINQASMVNSYRYDQLNRLTVNQPRQNNLPYALPEYDTMDEFFSYDGNGNIKTAFRHGDFFAAKKEMDDLTYNYNYDANGKLINNKLRHVNDALPYYGSNNPQDLHDQIADNYQYDPIGNLISDQQGAISNIKWTVYGKIDSITKTDGPSIKYRYDPSGQRASKTVNGLTTWYVRDAQGNTMAVYDNKSNQINWREQDLYGSSRLGMWEPNVNLANNNAATVWDTVGHKEYELANHLGNVLVTITDKRLPHSSNGTTIDYYEPEVKMAQEYFAFGAPIPKRNYFLNDKQYRYGFNGKENDNEVKLDWSGNPINGSQQDYGMRIYDPRLGRFLSVDPLTQSYPWYTPYQFAGNGPMSNVDIDGAEPKPTNRQNNKEGDFQQTSQISSNGLHNLVIKKTANWYWHDGSKGVAADWYSEEAYKQINLDWEHGQVMVPFRRDFFWEEDPYGKSGEMNLPGPGRDWQGWQVDKRGYLTGRKFQGGFFANFQLLEWISGEGEIRTLGALSEGRAFLKEGEYILYYGYKENKYKQIKPYIGSTVELLERYSVQEVEEMSARGFKFFMDNPSVRMPNRGIAIGFEQLVLRLNNAGENINKANQGLRLANKINAAIKEIYVGEAMKWAEKNIPNWRELFKIIQ